MSTSQTTLQVSFVSESAAYENTLGWYDRVTGYGGILFADVEADGRHAPLVSGVSSASFTVNTAELGNIEFFLVSDGYNLNKNDADDLTGAVKVIQLADGSWAVADVDSHGNVITTHGKADILAGQGADALFTETSKNAGGVDYASSAVGANQTASTLAGDTADGPTGLLAWEDLAATRNKNGTYSKPGDADYNDAVFQVSIVGGNHAPVAHADSISVSEDAGPTTINVLANDTDIDVGDALRVSAVGTAGLLGTVTIAAGGQSITYAPAASFQALAAGETATETFSYTIADQAGATSTASVTVTIVGVNDAPVVTGAVAGAATEDGATSTLNALANASDVDAGAILSVVNVSANLPAGVTYNASSHSFTLDPSASAYQSLAAGQTTTVSVSYGVSDGTSTTPATASWTVTGTNDAPVVAGAVSGRATEDGAASALDALATASDVDVGTTLSVVAPAALPPGVTYNAATHSFTLDPSASAYQSLAAGQTTTVSVSYGVSDGTSTTPATASWTVTGTNDAPVVAGAVSGRATEDGAASALDALATASDVDVGTTLSVVAPAALPPGVTYNAATHSFTLDPSASAYQSLAAGQTTTVSVSYGVSDGTSTTPATASWTVTGTNDAPVVAGAVSGRATEDGAASALDALATASDVDVGTTLSVVAPAALPPGVTYNAATHSFTLDPSASAYQSLAAGQTTTVSVSYGVSDGTSTTPATVSWTVTGTNDAPVVAGAVPGRATEDGAASALDALATASDIDAGTTLSVVNVSANLPAGVTYNADSHSFTLDPSASAYQSLAAGQTTTVSVSYGVSDGTSTTPATVSWTVTGTNDAPVITTDATQSVAENTTSVAALTSTDVDGGANPATFTITGGADAGLFDIAGSNLVFKSAPDFEANGSAAGTNSYQVEVTANDGTDRSAEMITVNVTDVNEPPSGIFLSNSSVNEGAPGAVVGTLTADRPDSGDTFTVDDQRFEVTDAGVLKLKDGIALDFEGEPQVAVKVTVTDLGASVERAFTVDVIDGFESSVVDGYIAGATVFADDNNNGVLDPGEASTTTDAVGNFVLFGGSGPLVMAGGTDISTGQPFSGLLSAPSGAKVVTPLTTLLLAVADDCGLSLHDAGATVLRGLGLPDTIDLASFDPVAAMVSSDTSVQAVGPQAFTAAIAVQDTVAQLSALFSGAGASADAAMSAAVAALATELGALAAPQTIDLAGESSIATLIARMADTFSPAIHDRVMKIADDAAVVIADVNAFVQAAPSVATTTDDLLHTVTRAADVAQNAAADALRTAAQSGDASALRAFTGPALISAISGGTALDVLGANVDQVLAGTDHADTLFGYGGNDTILGGDGNDLLDGGDGNDLLDGGVGLDKAIYGDATRGIVVNFADGVVTGGGVGTDTLRAIETVQGSAFDDTFDATGYGPASRFGDASANAPSEIANGYGNAAFEGMGGNDTITGSWVPTNASYQNAAAGVTVDLAHHTAYGTAPGDVAGVGTDTLTNVAGALGSRFDDTLLGDDNANFFVGGAGNDFIDGGGDRDLVRYATLSGDYTTTAGITVDLADGIVTGDASVGTDTLRSIEAIRGSNFADVYDARRFGATSTNAGSIGTSNEFEGMAGDDTIIGNGSTTIAYYSALSGVTVDLAAGTASGDNSVGDDTFSGVSGVIGSRFDDTLHGSNNADGFTGGRGDDLLDGLGGFDRATYNVDIYTTQGIQVDMADGTVSGDETVGHDTLRSIEFVRGTQFADTYTAAGLTTSSPNAGSQGADRNGATYNEFEGMGGNDTITGNGNTQIDYVSATAGVSVDLTGGTAVGDASVGIDTLLAGISRVRGSSFNDTIVGNGGDNTLDGQAGDNTLDGRGGNDRLVGGTGFDLAVYSNDAAVTTGISVDMAAGQVIGDTMVGTDTLQSVEAVRGTRFADTYTAVAFAATGANAGSAGTDITGAAFNEFEGMGGNDAITGNGNTRISYVSATAGVGVDLTAGMAFGDASVGTDTFTGVSQVRGSNFHDVIVGNGSDNILDGQGGNDTLDGRGGNDTLTGGAGADTFVESSGGGADTITDFSHSDGDRIDLRGLSGVYTLADVQAAQSGDNAVLTLGGGNTLTLDHVTATSLAAGDFVFAATPGAIIVGTAGSETLTGTAANDTLQGMAGNDTLNGLGGRDWAVYTDASAGISVDLKAGTVSGTGAGVGTDTLRSIELVRGSNFGDTYVATGFGPNGPNIGSFGTSNAFEGMGGDDSVTGNGNTSISFMNATAGVTVNFTAVGAGTASGDLSVGTDTFTGVVAVRGSAFADAFSGSTTANDQFTGGAGNDVIDGRGGGDRAMYWSPFDDTVTGGVTVNMAAGTVVGDASVGTDTLKSIEFIRGSKFADTYDAVGFSGSSINAGSSGTLNEIEGMGGDDLIIGNGNTRVVFFQASAGVTADIQAGTSSSIGANDAAGVGNDTFSGVFGLAGSSSDDKLYGSDNAVTTEEFSGGAGNDLMDGRGGYDRAVYNINGETSGITVHLAAGTVTSVDGSVGADTLRSIEAVRGTNSVDTYDATGFSGTSTNAGSSGTLNEFEGLAGNDTITGNGNTWISYENAAAGVTVNFTAGTAIGDGSVGADTFSGVSGVLGSNYNDTITGGSGNDTLEGFGGNDTLDGGGGRDWAVYTDATGGVTVNLAAGTVSGSGVGNDTLKSIEIVQGSNFADTYNATGFSGTSTNAGSAGTSNVFEGMGGNDTITGNGNTNVNYEHATAGVTVDLAAGTATGDASVGSDTFTGVAIVRGSAFADTLSGSDSTKLTEGFGGGAGNDLIDGRGGFDRAMYWAPFDDTVTGGITVNMAAGTVIGDASVGTDTLRAVEAIRGSRFADTYDATGFSATSTNAGSSGTLNEFEGMGGNDTITGNGNTRVVFFNASAGVTADIQAGTSSSIGGNDAAGVGNDTFSGVFGLAGSPYADTLYGSDNAVTTEEFSGGAGVDLIDGRGGYDRAVYNINSETGGVHVDMASGTVTGDGSVGTDTLRSIEAVRGTSFADTYVATGFGGGSTNAGSSGTLNEFEGLGGDDSITGNGATRLSFATASGGVTADIQAGKSSSIGGNDAAGVGSDTFAGVNGLNGSSFADKLYGSSASEYISGGGGNDTIDGRGGGDTLIGGAGADMFVFRSTQTGGDTIADFSLGDAIDLADFNAASATLGYSGDGTSGTLTVTAGSNAISIALLGNYVAASFATASDGQGGTLVTELPPDPSSQLVAQPHP